MKISPTDYLKARFGGQPLFDLFAYDANDPSGPACAPALDVLLAEYLALNTAKKLVSSFNPRSKEHVVIDKASGTIIGSFEEDPLPIIFSNTQPSTPQILSSISNQKSLISNSPPCSIHLKLYPTQGKAFYYPGQTIDVKGKTESEIDAIAETLAATAEKERGVTVKRIHVIRYQCEKSTKVRSAKVKSER